MSKKNIAIILFLIVVAVTVFFLWPSDVTRIRKVIKRGTTGFEQKNIEEIMACVSFTYHDEYGMSYLLIKKGVERFLKQLDRIKIEYENLEINVGEKIATAELDVWVIGRRGEHTQYVIGDFDTPLHITFTLGKERMKWLVVGTQGLPKYY